MGIAWFVAFAKPEVTPMSDKYDKLAALLMGSAMTGLVIGVARGVIQRRYTGWAQWISLLVGATLVAVLVGLAVHDTDMPEAAKWAVVGACTFVAEDILAGLSAIAGTFRKDPIGMLRILWDALRGTGGKIDKKGKP